MPTSSDPTDRRRGAWLLASLAAISAAAGCGQPQVEAEHRELVLRLATATSTQDRAALDRAAEEVDRLDTQGALGDAQRAAFAAILERARRGDWERARDLAYDLRDAQRPTAEDRRRVAERILPEIKRPGSTQAGPPG